MIKQATYRDDKNSLIITKPYKDHVMLNINGKKITIPENALNEMLKNADTPCKLFCEINKEREEKGIKLEILEEEDSPAFFTERG